MDVINETGAMVLRPARKKKAEASDESEVSDGFEAGGEFEASDGSEAID